MSVFHIVYTQSTSTSKCVSECNDKSRYTSSNYAHNKSWHNFPCDVITISERAFICPCLSMNAASK